MQNPRNILIIDDEAVTLKLTKVGLERLGYQVAVFSKPQDAINYFQKHNKLIHLVITDKNMPVISGEEILIQFKNINPEVPVTILTGFIDEAQDQELRKLGSAKNLLKPISLKELTKEIEELLNTSH